MKITVMASLLAKRYVKINAGHFWLMVIGCLCLGINMVSAQNSHFLEIIAVDKDKSFPEKNITFKNRFEDVLDVSDELGKVLGQLYDQAYLSASVDSIYRKDSLHQAYLYVGKKYEWASLENGNIDPVFLDQIGFREKLYSGKPFYYKEVRKLLDKLLGYAESHGYPFANVRLGDVKVEDNRISAKLFLQKNDLIVIDGIEVVGDAKISSQYLESYLGMKKGSLYDEKKVIDVRKKLREVQFLKEEKPLNVTFIDDKATVNLFLENRKSSRFDFLIGFLPKSQETGKLILTGNAEIDLKNPFGTGKEIRFEWQQLRPGTQELDIHFLYPYVAGLPFGFQFDFNLYKRDSSYLDLDRDISVQYHLDGNNYLGAYWNNLRSTTLTVNTQQVINSQMLPANLDISHSTFGLEYRLSKLDYRFNPRKGFDLKLRGGSGVKKIIENNKILELEDPENPDFEFASLYDSLDLRTFQFRITGNFAWYFPVGERSVFKAGYNGGIMSSGETRYQNELFRIGGTRILRGFDEESIFASFFSIFTAEYRLIISQNSYIYAFGDYGFVQNKSQGSDLSDTPFGFGVGMTFETKAGIFGINYALGSQQGNPIDFSAGKIHFGYVNYF